VSSVLGRRRYQMLLALWWLLLVRARSGAGEVDHHHLHHHHPLYLNSIRLNSPYRFPPLWYVIGWVLMTHAAALNCHDVDDMTSWFIPVDVAFDSGATWCLARYM